jgi:hypothetical protein
MSCLSLYGTAIEEAIKVARLGFAFPFLIFYVRVENLVIKRQSRNLFDLPSTCISS